MILISVMLAICIVIIWLMPKRLSWSEMYVTWAMVTLITTFVDALCDPILHLYHYYEDKIEIRDLLIEVMTGFFGPIVLNFMPQKVTRFIFYAVIWTVISVCVELLAVKIHVLTYHRWSTWYSIPVYPAGCVFLRWHLRFIRTAM